MPSHSLGMFLAVGVCLLAGLPGPNAGVDAALVLPQPFRGAAAAAAGAAAPPGPDTWCETCKAFVARVEEEGCDLACQELPEGPREICEKLFPYQTCEDILDWLTKGKLSPLHVCGRLGLCTKGCPCGRCSDLFLGDCLADDADRCDQPLRLGSGVPLPKELRRRGACAKGACGDANSSGCCLHC